MHRPKPQPPPKSDTILKKLSDRPKPNSSKSKKHPTPHQPLSKYSPYQQKDSDQDKQNSDIAQLALRIISGAAQTRQKQILLNLATQMQKQQKLKIFLLQKQSAHDLSDLYSMLTHLRQQQLKQLNSLKIQIGKRKLKNLDQHDLRQDLINLNSYIMRRTKNDTIQIKNQGIDLIIQIYNKFDQQSKIIYQLINNYQKNIKKYQSYQQYHLTLFQSSSNTTHSIKQSNTHHNSINHNQQIHINKNQNQQLYLSLTYHQLLTKFLQLTTQNTTLSKQLKKIQQQFEYVVEQKLILQDKYQRYRQNTKSKKSTLFLFIQSLKDKIYQFKDLHDFHKQQTNDLINSFQSQLQTAQLDIRQFLLSQRSSPHSDSNDEGVNLFSTPHSFSHHQQHSPDMLSNQNITQRSSSDIMIQRYEQVITQKQLQINHYLKTISHLNNQIQNQASSFQQQKHKIKHKTNRQILSIKQQILQLKNSIVFINNQLQSSKINIQSSIDLFYQHFQNLINKYISSQIQQLQHHLKQINHLQIQNTTSQSQLLQTHTQITHLQQKIKQLQLQLLQNNNILSSKQLTIQQSKSSYMSQISSISNQLTLQQQKNNATTQHINSLQKQVILLKKGNYHYIQQYQSLITQFNNTEQQKNLSIKALKQQIQTLLNTINHLQTQKQQLSQKYTNQQIKYNNLQKQNLQTQQQLTYFKLQNQLILIKNNQLQQIIQLKQQQIHKIKLQYQNFKDSTISQCGMLLQSKSQQILQIKLQVQRQKIIKQDLLSFLQQFVTKNQNQLSSIKCQILHQVTKQIHLIKQGLLFLKSNQQYMRQVISAFSIYFQNFKKQCTTNMEQLLQQYTSPQTIDISTQTSLLPLLKVDLNTVNIQLSTPKTNSDWHAIITILHDICSSIQQSIITQESPQLSSPDISQKLHQCKAILSTLKPKKQQIKPQNDNLQQQQLNFNLTIQDPQPHPSQPTPIQLTQIPIPSSSSPNKLFSQQFSQQQHQNFLTTISNINILSILDQSIINQQVTVLKYQLLQFIKINQKLNNQLKFYQQKDLDKIFDF